MAHSDHESVPLSSRVLKVHAQGWRGEERTRGLGRSPEQVHLAGAELQGAHPAGRVRPPQEARREGAWQSRKLRQSCGPADGVTWVQGQVQVDMPTKEFGPEAGLRGLAAPQQGDWAPGPSPGLQAHLPCPSFYPLKTGEKDAGRYQRSRGVSNSSLQLGRQEKNIVPRREEF